MNLFLYKTLFILIFFVAPNIYATEKGAVCETLLNVININTNADEITSIVNNYVTSDSLSTQIAIINSDINTI